MAVPDFQTLMRPLLDQYAAGFERPIADVRSTLADQFALTDDERAERFAEWFGENVRQPRWLGSDVSEPLRSS